MKQAIFDQLEGYMLQCMRDSAHDKEHVYRVLYLALDIAEHEPHADSDVLIAACLLHDIGRQAQYDDPTVCHAVHGAEMAETYLKEQGSIPFLFTVYATVSAATASGKTRRRRVWKQESCLMPINWMSPVPWASPEPCCITVKWTSPCTT